jgi:hypothetical protein
MRPEGRKFECGCLVAYRSRSDAPPGVEKGKELALLVKGGKLVLPAGEPRPILAADYVVRLIGGLPSDHPLHALFGPGHVIVPAPGHALNQPGKSPLGLLAERMAAAGLGMGFEDVIKRKVAVPKMSLQPAGQRFGHAQHRETMEAKAISTPASTILVIDDVVTSGATLYAACLAISDANPGVKVKAFGVSRTDQSAAEFMFCKVGLLGPTGLDV